MMKFCRWHACIWSLISCLVACETGTLKPNQHPETRLFLDEIILSGDSRLNSVVRLHWLGEDVDGYVTGYELSFDGETWWHTTTTDSTFRFALEGNADTADVIIRVRALDNLGAADLSPDTLRIPIRNTPPVAVFDPQNPVDDSVRSVWSLIWQLSDLDGAETLDSVFVRANNGPWIGFRAQVSLLTLIPESPETAGVQSARILSGPEASPVAARLQGIEVGALNRMYVRVRDIAGTYSAIDSTGAFFLHRKTGDLLLIDDHGDAAADAFYPPLMDIVYPAYDRLDLRANLPAFWDPTFRQLLGLYDKVMWYSDAAPLATLGQQAILEIAASPIQNYLNAGGKLLVTASFPVVFSTVGEKNRSPLFGFTPMDSFSTAAGQARIPINNRLLPLAPGLDTLVCSAFVTGADPFYAKSSLNDLYTAILSTSGGWTGPRTVAGRTVFTNGQTNQVFFSVDLFKFNGDPAALQETLSYILTTTFGW